MCSEGKVCLRVTLWRGVSGVLAAVSAVVVAVAGASVLDAEVANAERVVAGKVIGDADVSDSDLASYWAPIHYQDTDDTDADADYLSRVDFDGDWSGDNNWAHQDDDGARLTGAAYYSVARTRTHWFVTYSFFHPRDWCDENLCRSFDKHHENDMEGVLLSVRRTKSGYGKLEGMVSVAHSDFYSFTPPGSPYRDGNENIDGTIPMRADGGHDRPTTFQEAKGHGQKAWNGENFPGGDGVVYYPRALGEVPADGDDRNVGYRLIDTFADGGLWSHRSDSATFASFGTFRGDDGKANAANTAWKWDDQDDGPGAGAMAADPAMLIANYFAGEGDFARTYERNPYCLGSTPHVAGCR